MHYTINLVDTYNSGMAFLFAIRGQLQICCSLPLFGVLYSDTQALRCLTAHNKPVVR